MKKETIISSDPFN